MKKPRPETPQQLIGQQIKKQVAVGRLGKGLAKAEAAHLKGKGYDPQSVTAVERARAANARRGVKIPK